MPPKPPLTSTTRTVTPRLSAAERRAVQIAGLATQQSDLKREAAERRVARELRGDPVPARTLAAQPFAPRLAG